MVEHLRDVRNTGFWVDVTCDIPIPCDSRTESNVMDGNKIKTESEVDRLIRKTVEQGHSLGCARQAILPAPGEELVAPKCICSGGING